MEPTQWAIDESYRIVCEHAWGWDENGSDDLTDDQQEHVNALALELDAIADYFSANPRESK